MRYFKSHPSPPKKYCLWAVRRKACFHEILTNIKTNILLGGRHSCSQVASLLLVVGVLLVLVLNFFLFGNLTLILYFLFLPQADMDSLEGNDTPKSSHKPFHQSHKLHTHYQLQEGALQRAGSCHRHSPLARPPNHSASVLWGPWGYSLDCVLTIMIIGHFFGQCRSKESVQPDLSPVGH